MRRINLLQLQIGTFLLIGVLGVVYATFSVIGVNLLHRPFHVHVRLSDAGGYFDTDNIITNETSYLHALDALRKQGVHGGAYIGVGPDQNFSYIGRIRPAEAFIVEHTNRELARWSRGTLQRPSARAAPSPIAAKRPRKKGGPR